MTTRFLLYSISFLTLFISESCRTKTVSDPQVIKAEIDKILKVQEDAYDQGNEEGRKILAQTCDDSLIFIGGDDGGLAQSADFYVHDLADGYSKRPHNRIYRIFDNTVVVSAQQQTFKLFNKDSIFFNSLYTKVFVKEEGKWKMVFVTYAPLPVHYNKPIKIDSSLLQVYSGLYKTGEVSVDTVSVFDGKLYIGQSESTRSELIPINDSTFIGEGYNGYTVFTKTSTGTVSRMYYQYPDGQRIISPRL